MGFRIFKGGELYETGEKQQLLDLIDQLKAYFNEPDEDIYLLVDPKLGQKTGQIDCLFYRQGKITIFELKDIRGDFIPEIDENTPWKTIESGENKDIFTDRQHPFVQTRVQRSNLNTFIREKVMTEKKKLEDEEFKKRLGKYISAWVITSSQSKPHKDVNNDNKNPWFKVFPIGREFAEELSKNTTSSNDSISEHTFNGLLNATESKETDEKDIFFRVVAPELQMGRLPKVEVLLKSEKDQDVQLAIKYCKEFQLIRYFSSLIEKCKNSEGPVRVAALSVIFEWLKSYESKFNEEEISDLVKFTLTNSDYKTRELGLSFLVESGYEIEEELQDVICERMNEENYPILIVLFVQAIKYFKNKAIAQDQLLSFYSKIESNFFSLASGVGEKFKELEKQTEIYQASSMTEMNEEATVNKILDEYEKMRIQSEWWTRIANTWLDVSSSVGGVSLGAKILSHSKRIMSELHSPKDSYSYTPPTFIKSIGIIAKLMPEGSVDFLLGLLDGDVGNKVILAVVEALGSFDNLRSKDKLREFLNGHQYDDESDLHEIRMFSSDSLSRLKDKESFDRIWELFLDEEKKELIYVNKSFFNSLISLDSIKLERNLWDLIEKAEFSEECLATYSDLIKKCGGKYTFEKCSELVSKKRINSDDYYNSPIGILRYLGRNVSSLRHDATFLGRRFLKSSRDDLECIGIELAEPHFLKRPIDLEKYEKSNNIDTLYAIISIYSRLKRTDKLELFAKNANMDISRSAFNNLRLVAPKRYYNGYLFVENGKASDCELITSDTGIFIETEDFSGKKYTPMIVRFFKWNDLIGTKRIFVGESQIGIITCTRSENGNCFSIFPRKAVSLETLDNKNAFEDDGIKKVIESIESLDIKDRSKELTSTSRELYDTFKLAFAKVEHYNKKYTNINQEFEKSFNPEEMSIK